MIRDYKNVYVKNSTSKSKMEHVLIVQIKVYIRVDYVCVSLTTT